MKNLTYHIITIGCQMNKSDSERIAVCLEDCGYKENADKSKADLVVLTTCGVRQAAEDRVYGLVVKIKKENKHAKIILAGCLSERADVIKKLKDKIDIWLPARKIADIKFIISGFRRPTSGSFPTSDVGRGERSDYLKIKPKYSFNFSAFVPIGNGCDNFCTYCVVPYARGREAYRPANEIINEVRDLVVQGYKEIVLIAQNVNSYKPCKAYFCHSRESGNLCGGKNECFNFPDLLRAVNDIPGDFWIRFATSHPKDMSDDLIAAINDCEKVCKHIHLPAQAGDNEILRAMNRKYTVEHYLGLIKKIKNNIKSDLPVALTTDIIVGFPGETKKQFANTIKLFKKVKYDMAYIAQYSPRPGTAAEKLEDNVPQAEKKRREKELTEVLRITALENNQKYSGKIVKALVEGKNKKGGLIARTGANKTVKFFGADDLLGKFVDIKITGVKDFGLSGFLEKLN